MINLSDRKRMLIERVQQLQGQLAQANAAVENTKVELAKVIGQLELINDLEKSEVNNSDLRRAPTVNTQ